MRHRKDSKGRVLKDGESERKQGGYQYRWTDSFGVRHCIYGRTLDVLREKEKRPVCIVANTKMTVSELFALWLDFRQDLRPSTIYGYRSCFRNHIEPDLGDLILSKVNSRLLFAFKTKLIKSDLSVHVTGNAFAILNSMFDYAVTSEIIVSNPVPAIQGTIKRDYSKTRRGLTVNEQRIILDYFKDDELEPLITFLLLTGTRINEALALTIKDIDFDKNVISINKSLSYCTRDGEHSGLHISVPKTESGVRRIPCPRVLRDYFYNRLDKKTIKIDGISGFVFTNQNRKPFSVAYVNNRLKEATGGKFTCSCHVLRHTFTTRLIENGANPKTVQSLLGHKSINTTFNVYTDFSEKMMKEAEHVLNTYII